MNLYLPILVLGGIAAAFALGSVALAQITGPSRFNRAKLEAYECGIEPSDQPANAPHAFTNAGEAPARLLCLCAPAGQEEFFTLVGQPVATRTEPPPPLDAGAQAAFVANSRALAPRYKTELLPPPGRD